MNVVLVLLLHIKMLYIRLCIWRPFMRQLKNPKKTQQRRLKAILNDNRNTEFAIKHHFQTLQSYEDFKERVAVNDYETLRPFIEKQAEERTPAITRETADFYGKTSGTLGASKFLPITSSLISQYRLSQHLASYALYRQIAGVYSGKILAIVSPAIEGETAWGIPYGSMSGLIYRSMPRLLRHRYVVPYDLFELADYELKYYLITLFALLEENISMIATANPSTLIKIIDIIKHQRERLCHHLRSADISDLHLLAKPLQKNLIFKLQNQAPRNQFLINLLSSKEPVRFCQLWPQLKAIATWTGGNCQTLLPLVHAELKTSIPIVEMGYLSTEFRGSITVDALNNISVPTIHENFFEFVLKDDWENKLAKFITVESLEPGQLYYVFVTTGNGLYRYFINDIIEAGPRVYHTPAIKFIQKGQGVCNLTGEKLTEQQLLLAVNKLQEEGLCEQTFFVLLGDAEHLKYTLYVEADGVPNRIAAHLEETLSILNNEFKAKRQSGRLKQTDVVLLKHGTREAYKKHCLNKGQRESQFKYLTLQLKELCGFEFETYQRQDDRC